jgi:hypothetical protein
MDQGLLKFRGRQKRRNVEIARKAGIRVRVADRQVRPHSCRSRRGWRRQGLLTTRIRHTRMYPGMSGAGESGRPGSMNAFGMMAPQSVLRRTLFCTKTGNTKYFSFPSAQRLATPLAADLIIRFSVWLLEGCVVPSKNKFGLSRNIPEGIQREVRFRSKNGCVNCRRGIFQYEHIDPEFSEAKIHDPNLICLLCGSCHDKVTRGLLTKQTVLLKYQEVQNSSPQEPHDFFDLVGENPKVLIGGLITSATPKVIFEVDGHSIFRISGKQGEEPAGIHAIFSDGRGNHIFSIAGNRWEGPSQMYDLDTQGRVLEVRLPNGNISLRLKYGSPDQISVDHIDMRFGSWHLLASEHDLAIGRYTGIDNNLIWMHIKAHVNNVINSSCLIKCTTKKLPLKVKGKSASIFAPLRIYFNQDGHKDRFLTTYPNQLIPDVALKSGISWPDLGLSFLVDTNFSFGAALTGVCSIDHAKYHFFRRSRMNAPAVLLPAVLNKASVEEAVSLFEKNGGGAGSLAPEPFLVRPDAMAIQRWQARSLSGKPNKNLFDEEPGFSWGTGTIKLSDSYNGPAIRVTREQ